MDHSSTPLIFWNMAFFIGSPHQIAHTCMARPQRKLTLPSLISGIQALMAHPVSCNLALECEPTENRAEDAKQAPNPHSFPHYNQSIMFLMRDLCNHAAEGKQANEVREYHQAIKEV